MGSHRDNTRLGKIAIAGMTIAFLAFIWFVLMLGMAITGVWR